MKEKALITSFFAAMTIDPAVSAYALSSELGFTDINPLANSDLADGFLDSSIMLKMADTALLIGLYALAKNKEMKRTTFVFEGAIVTSNLIMWGVVLWNTAQVVHALGQ